MKMMTRILFWILMMVLTLPSLGISAGDNGYDPAGAGHSWNGTISLNDGRELDHFFKAKEYVFKRNWGKAREGFEDYLKDYPEGQVRDEATFWLAQSLNMLSKTVSKGSDILGLKRQAVEKLNTLIAQFPDSLWRDDGLALRVEISGQLVLGGHSEYKTYINEAVKTQKKDEAQLKLLAIHSLAELDVDFSLPLLSRILESDPDPVMRKQSVSIMGRYFPGKSLSLLRKCQKSDQDENVRAEALRWVERFEAHAIPVQLGYHIYGCRILDESLLGLYPEAKGFIVHVPVDRAGSVSSVLKHLREQFGGKLSRFLSSAKGTMPFPGTYPGEDRVIVSHRAGQYQIRIKTETLNISEAEIQGDIEFKNRGTGAVFSESFQLSAGETKLMTAHHGDLLSIVILRFEKKAGGETTVAAGDTKFSSTADKILSKIGLSDHGQLTLNGIFNLKPHVKILSERKHFDIDEFSKNLLNFGQGKAELRKPGKQFGENEPWRLLGDILWLKEQKRLVGFGALLLNPDREVIASGIISVSLDDPAAFRLLKGRTWREKELLLEDREPRTRHYYPTLTTNVHGWQVYSTLHSNPSLSKRGLADYSLSQAARSLNGVEWILLGHILLNKSERQFIARQALLINSEGYLVYGDELVVPTEEPSRTVIRKK